MITKFIKYNESIKSLLVGPTKDELLDYIINSENPFKSLLKAISLNYYEGIQYIIKTYPNDTKIQGIYSWYETYLKKWFSDTMKLTRVVDNKNITLLDQDIESIDNNIYYVNSYTGQIYLEISNEDGEEIYYYSHEYFYNTLSNDSKLFWSESENVLLGLTKYYFNETPNKATFATFEHVKYER